MSKAPGSSIPSVPRWTDLLSGLQQRHSGIWRRLGNMESRLLAEQLESINLQQPIYIAGLARSGTTILLELLARHPQLATHRYRDFPPVMTPWFWNWFVDRASTRQQTASERAHGDGIEVTAESPEAFEEVIWMAFFAHLHDPRVSAVLDAATSNPEFESFYRDHLRKMLLIRGGERYLSKANYNVTRFGYLLKLFPDARFILPVRDPVRHIASLMRQHERFCREHARDARLQRHMSRSGHFEFGLDRRPINSGDGKAIEEVCELWSRQQHVEGWAHYWKDLYGHVADTLHNDASLRRATLVVRYEDLCARPAPTLAKVIAHCALTSDAEALTTVAAGTVRHPSYYKPDLTEQQDAIIRSVTGSVRERLDVLAGAA